MFFWRWRRRQSKVTIGEEGEKERPFVKKYLVLLLRFCSVCCPVRQTNELQKILYNFHPGNVSGMRQQQRTSKWRGAKNVIERWERENFEEEMRGSLSPMSDTTFFGQGEETEKGEIPSWQTVSLRRTRGPRTSTRTAQKTSSIACFCFFPKEVFRWSN